MDSKKELERLLDRNTSLIDKLHNCLISGGVEIPKEIESEVKKLKLCGVLKPFVCGEETIGSKRCDNLCMRLDCQQLNHDAN